MKANMGTVDRIVRVLVGLAIIGAGIYYQSLWGLVGVAFIAISAIGICPPYALFGINTSRVKN